MSTITQPLREEHKELYPHVEELRLAAEAVTEKPADTLFPLIQSAYSFLTRGLLPHAQAEDHALYPVVQRVMGAREATATMSRDHVEVSRLTDELGVLRGEIRGQALSPDQARELRRVLYGLYALVKLHFAKEEEIYLPLLDARLSPQEGKAMFEAMEKAAHEAKEKLASNE